MFLRYFLPVIFGVINWVSGIFHLPAEVFSWKSCFVLQEVVYVCVDAALGFFF